MGKSDQKEKQPDGNPAMEATGASSQPETDDGIREWFATLSIEERARALGFSDGTILSLLLKHGSLASSVSSKLEGVPESRTDKKDDWLESLNRHWMVRSVVIPMSGTSGEMESIEMNQAISNADGIKVVKAGQRSEPHCTPAKSGTEDAKYGESETLPMSDAYRIRIADGKSSSSIEKECDDPGESPSNPLHVLSSEDAVTSTMNNICIIFSSENLNAANATKHAFITLQPAYLREQNRADIVSMLDEILGHAIPGQSHVATPFESSWGSVRSSAFASAEKDRVSISLYGLVALRMKAAILDSHRLSIETATSTNSTSDATKPTTAEHGNSPVQAGSNWDLSSQVLECLAQLNSVSETGGMHLLPVSNGQQYLVLSMLMLLRELSASKSRNSTHFSSDSFTHFIQQCFQEASGDDFHKLSSGAAVDSKYLDSLRGSSAHMVGTVQDDDETTEQVSRPTGAGKKKKRKKKKRKGSSGQSQNMGGKLQGSTTKQQENMSLAAQDERIPKTNVPSPESPEGRDEESEKTIISGKDSKGAISSVSDPQMMNTKPELSEDCAPESQENKTSLTGDNSDSQDEDDGRNEILDKDATENAQIGQGSINNTKSLGQNIIAGLSTAGDIENDDSGEWETVEIKGRGSRKKASDRANQNRFQSYQHGQSQNGSTGTGSKKSKSSRNSNRKQRANMRKIVREILTNVLDRVDEDVQRRRQLRREPSHPAASNRGSASTPIGSKGTTNESRIKPPSKTSHQPKDMSMRDIVVSRQEDTAKHNKSPVRSTMNRPRQRDGRSGQGQIRRGADGFMYREKTTATSTSVDQNTVPTLPETLSAVSATSARNVTVQDAEVVQGDTSSGDSAEGPKPKLSQNDKDASPPLPTLLSPENANSASSSVASSLDTSHAGRQSSHIACQQGKEKDVGYHLLDVCDRLTRDINIFMKRREYALDVRRRERGAVLMALQGTVSSIWPNVCNVEMYGSCATQLDLPSSDLDVVVTGLYIPPEKVSRSPNIGSPRKISECIDDSNAPSVNGSSGGNSNGDKSSKITLMERSAPQQVGHLHPGYTQLSQNAERIVRLAVELERQPWAVHVKAIPTASVPVIKILADPTRISGNGEWLMQAPSAAEASAVSSNERGMIEHGKTNSSAPASMPPFPSQQALPWRGADVMNGLLKVDITFEGPEHGGIGSTKFSSRVVKEFCDETGLPQDCTPAVQVLMVVKELLAQRRLNEPFSGGLSSYALLLLVISVLRERAIICQELERVERQRQLVAAENVDQRIGGFPLNAPLSVEKSSPDMKSSEPAPKKSSSKPSWNVAARGASSSTQITNVRAQSVPKKANAAPPVEVAPSSWASIAMKSSSQGNAMATKDRGEKVTSKKSARPQQPKTVRKASSFADAVANGPCGPRQTNRNVGLTSQSRKGESQHSQKSFLVSPKATAATEQGSSSQSTNFLKVASPPFAPPASAALGAKGVQSQADDSSFTEQRSMFPQGFHDVTEVLCSGETTAGKLLMHFLLFYGQHFDSQSTAIDYSGIHKRDVSRNNGYSQVSPYLRRRTGGSYDPMTGMLTVDPIVVYDPLEGAEMNNVARSCFAWSSIRWVFAQSYLTLLSTVEINQNHTTGQGVNAHGISRSEGKHQSRSQNENGLSHPWNGPYGHDKSGNMMIDASSPLLELLLSF